VGKIEIRITFWSGNQTGNDGMEKKILRLSQRTNEFEVKMDRLGIESIGELFVRCNGPFRSKIADNFLTDCETGNSHFASKTTYQVVPFL